MITKLQLPSLSPTMEEGTIAKWHVKVGDQIKNDTLLCSVETDKTTMDYNSLDEGFLRIILIPEGKVAKVNDLMAILTDKPDEEYQTELDQLLAEQNAAASPVPAPSAPSPVATPAPTPTPVAAAPVLSYQAPIYTAPIAAPSASSAPATPVKASPLARKIAQDKKIDLSTIKGSGPNGRIIVADLANAPIPSPTAPKTADKTAAKKIEKAQIGSLAAIVPTFDQPMTTMQKVVGKRLLESYLAAPSFLVSIKIDIDRANELRAQLNTVPGYKISINDLIIKAVALNLRRNALVNATLLGDAIRFNANIDISVAVAIDGGLITPIIKDADHKPLGIISAEMKDLAGRAKSGALQPHEFQGGTFTISNLGMFGVSSFTSIINPPQSAILAVAAAEECPYRTETGEIAFKNVITVTLTSDHRVINGAIAAEFVSGLKEILENPATLML